MSVRIAAHAITAAALGPVAFTAVAAPPQPIAQRVQLQLAPDEVAAVAREHGLGRDHGPRDQASYWATPNQLAALEATGVPVVHAPQPPPPGGSSYRMPEQGDAVLYDLAASSDRAGLVRLGASIEGRPIEALWLGQPPESGAPAHRILAGHHGDEWSSFEVALATAQALREGDGTDPGITALLDQATIWVVPYVNPDGVVGASRWNARGVDLNRNYDYAWSDSEFLPGPQPFSEPEVRAVRDFAHWVQPVLGLSLHSGAANFGWVWNHTTQPTVDASALEDHARRYAANTTTEAFWITNGADWYVTRGDTNDWAYGRHGQWDSTVELTEDKSPESFRIPGFVADHLPAMLDFVAVLPDVSGQVLSADAGLPVDASVTLLGRDGPLTRSFRTEPGTGWFHRLSDGEATDVFVSAPGYLDATVPVGTTPIHLVPDGLVDAALLPAPAVAGDAVELPEPLDGLVTLVQAGHEDVEVLADYGVLDLDPGALAPGAWTAILPDGSTVRHGLLRPSTADALTVTNPTEDEVRISGVPFPIGTRAWAVFGADRARLPVLATPEGDTLRIDLTEVPDDGRVDLWILAGGRHHFAADLYESAPETYGLDLGKPVLVGRACACDVKPGHLPAHVGSALSILLLLLIRRTP